MGGIQPCHPMIACAPLPPAPSPTTSRTPHSVEHRPRQTVLRQRYNLAQSKHAVAYCWRWRRTYFTLREDRLHEAQAASEDSSNHLKDPKPPPKALPKLQESKLPATSPRESKSSRAQDTKNKLSHHSLRNNRGSESACYHLQHHDMQGFSEPTTAKASFCITPKEIIEVRRMPSFIAINLAFRSRLRAQEPMRPRARFLMTP